MSTLEELRAQIDDIDAQMVALFEQRMNVTRQVGEYKRSTACLCWIGAVKRKFWRRKNPC